MPDNFSKTGERAIPNVNAPARGAQPPRPNSVGSNTGERTPGGHIMDGRGRDGQHYGDSSRAVPDNGMRTRTPEGIEVGQQSGHDIQDSVPKPDCYADTSTETKE